MPKTCIHTSCSRPVFGKGYCKNHQYLRTDKKPVVKRMYSTKREKLNRIYAKLRKWFLSNKLYCKIESPVCTTVASVIHHRRGRGRYFLDTTTWMASCVACNDYVEAHHAEAVAKGWKESRLANHPGNLTEMVLTDKKD